MTQMMKYEGLEGTQKNRVLVAVRFRPLRCGGGGACCFLRCGGSAARQPQLRPLWQEQSPVLRPINGKCCCILPGRPLRLRPSLAPCATIATRSAAGDVHLQLEGHGHGCCRIALLALIPDPFTFAGFS